MSILNAGVQTGGVVLGRCFVYCFVVCEVNSCTRCSEGEAIFFVCLSHCGYGWQMIWQRSILWLCCYSALMTEREGNLSSFQFKYERKTWWLMVF